MYEEYRNFYDSLAPTPKTPVNCPVCKTLLGYRLYKDEVYSEHCEDCKATFTWIKQDELPKAKLDCDKIKKSKQCDCGRCS